MENRQRSIRKLLWRITAVLAILAVVSICFVSGTFARYVTKKSGSFDSGVALWKITEEVTAGEGSVDVNLEKISPSKSPAKFTPGADSQNTIAEDDRRSKELTNITVKIKNEGDVDAYVMLDLGKVFNGYQYEFGTGGSIQTENGSRKVQDNAYTFPIGNESPAPDANIPTSTEWAKIFTATWGTAQITTPSTEGNQQGTTTTATAVNDTGSDYNGMYLVKPGETLSVAVTIKWNTDLDSDTDFEKDVAGCIDADYRDTWIGENIGKISLAYSWYAVQGSETPDTTQGN